MNLSQLPQGSVGVVTAVDAELAHSLRLRELGFRPGTAVRVTHRAAFGGRVVAIGADRFALDRSTCRRVEVEQES